MMNHIIGHPFRFAISTIKILCLGHLTITNVFQISAASGPSMLPTFTVDGDWMAADMRCRLGRRIAVGDLVFYKIPIFRNQNGVKRVIAMPGDYVSLGTPGEKGQHQMIQVPEGHCWIVGDNLTASRDSRSFGPLPLALVQGKVVAKVLPWKERMWTTDGLQSLKE
ncbi:hypothetical protein E4U21_007267 [Claviceps maximensis]|nr:hypothetical protein E4U21_007267 [Claviceps maximensis]